MDSEHPDADTDIIRAECTQILQSFLNEIRYKIPTYQLNTSLESQIKQHFYKEGFEENFIRGLHPIIETSAGIAATTFHSTPPEVQRTVGIYTTYAIAIDDRASTMKEDLKKFSSNLLAHMPQGNELLSSFALFLTGIHCIFGPFGGDMIIKDSFQFVSSCVLEVGANLQFPVDAPNFADYVRLKTGVAEAYAFMMFPEQQFPEEMWLGMYLPMISYMQGYFNSANDILSFYKETRGLEEYTFVNNSAKLLGLKPTLALRKICTDTAKLVERLRRLSTVHPRLEITMEGFIQGYVVYHLSQRRYRLRELGIPEVIEAEDRVNTK